MVQVVEAKLVYIAISQEDVLWIKVGMDYV